jgi:hypothetical protein
MRILQIVISFHLNAIEKQIQNQFSALGFKLQDFFKK